MIDFKEYSKQRSILRKRLERMKKAGHETERSKAILSRLRTETVEKVRKMSDAEQKYAMMRMRGWLNTPSLSLSGQKTHVAHVIARLHEIGYEQINSGNYDAFVHIMSMGKKMLGESFFYSIDNVTDVAQQFAVKKDEWGFFEWLARQTQTYSDAELSQMWWETNKSAK